MGERFISYFFDEYHKKSSAIQRWKRNAIYDHKVYGNDPKELKQICLADLSGFFGNTEYSYGSYNSRWDRSMYKELLDKIVECLHGEPGKDRSIF